MANRSPTLHTFDPDYFPARLNAFLNDGRYKVLRKLGEGVSSSSWLVYDEHGEYVSFCISTRNPGSRPTYSFLRFEPAGRPGSKYLAAKILTLDATQRHNTRQSRELEFLKQIEARDEIDYLAILRDHFIERGPYGDHLCLVQDLYSTSVSALRRSSPHKALPAYMTRNIVSMLVDALAQLHEMRIVHTGKP